MSWTFAQQDGDLFIDDGGKVVPISGIDKLDQDIGEELSVPYNEKTDLGNKLVPILRGRVPSAPLNKGSVSQEISSTIGRLQRAQQNDAYLTDQEAISHIERLIVVVDSETKTGFLYYLDVRNQATRRVEKRSFYTQNSYRVAPNASVRSRLGRP